MFSKEVSKTIKATKILTEQEEIDLFKNINEGNNRETIVVANLKLVAKVAYNYNTPHFTHDDLFMYGLIGLIHATHVFSTELNTRFASFAQWHIKNNVNIAMRDLSSHIRVPVNIQANIRKELKKVKGNHDELNHEVHQHFVLSNMSSLDAEVSDSNTKNLHDSFHDESVNIMENINAKQVSALIHNKLLSELDHREKSVVCKLLGIESHQHTLQDVADALSISKERVRQIKNSAIKKIKLATAKHNFTQDNLHAIFD